MLLLAFFSCERSAEERLETSPPDQFFVRLEHAKLAIGSTTFKESYAKDENGRIIDKKISSTQTVMKSINPSFYVINYQSGGFVIISADKRVNPILAFSKTDTFDYNQAKNQNGIGFWLAEQLKYIENIRLSKVKQDPNLEIYWDLLLKSVPPDDGGTDENPQITFSYIGSPISTNWDQGYGYNDYTPILNCGYHTPTGCVATAMAQIMKYKSYSSINNYIWSSMPNTTGSLEVARLMGDIGVSVNMQYGCYASGAYNTAIIPGFSHFGYNYVKAKNIAGQISDATLDNQFYLNQPVLMTGTNGSVGHAWVCDQLYSYSYWNGSYGYSYKMYHMNWGWSGSNNGLYYLNNLTPGGGSYNNDLTMFYDFQH